MLVSPIRRLLSFVGPKLDLAFAKPPRLLLRASAVSNQIAVLTPRVSHARFARHSAVRH